MKRKEPSSNNSQSSQSLLLVSGDNELERQVACTLTCAGVPCATLTTVACGHDAFGALVRGKPRLVVLDDELPDTTGLAFLHKLRQEGVKTLIVYVTAHHTLELEKMVRQLGVLYYTEKPPDPLVIRRITAAVFLPPRKGRRPDLCPYR
jgi:DNA-binding response OmpR family regulator